jgi:hypothetical protein
MKKLIVQTRSAAGFLKRAAAALMLTGLCTIAQAQTVTDPLQTAATDAIEDAKGIATTVLIAAFAIVVGFVVFKVIKRAISKV